MQTLVIAATNASQSPEPGLITKEAFHLSQETYQMFWVGPSTIIPDMHLEDGRNMREALSRGDICYVLYRRSIDEDLHQVVVARDRALLEDPQRSRMIYLSQEQFTQLVPWHRSLEYYDTGELLEQIRAHAALVLGDSGLNEDSHPRQAAPTTSQKRFNPHGLPPVFVSYEALEQAHRDMQEAGETASRSRRGIWAWRQISWLRALLVMIRARQKRSWLPRWLRKLQRIIKQMLEDPNSLRENLLNAKPILRGDEQVGLSVKLDFLFAFAHESRQVSAC